MEKIDESGGGVYYKGGGGAGFSPLQNQTGSRGPRLTLLREQAIQRGGSIHRKKPGWKLETVGGLDLGRTELKGDPEKETRERESFVHQLPAVGVDEFSLKLC